MHGALHRDGIKNINYLSKIEIIIYNYRIQTMVRILIPASHC